jgi:hypothetical protein
MHELHRKQGVKNVQEIKELNLTDSSQQESSCQSEKNVHQTSSGLIQQRKRAGFESIVPSQMPTQNKSKPI